jgi:hypothetical protein
MRRAGLRGRRGYRAAGAPALRRGANRRDRSAGRPRGAGLAGRAGRGRAWHERSSSALAARRRARWPRTRRGCRSRVRPLPSARPPASHACPHWLRKVSTMAACRTRAGVGCRLCTVCSPTGAAIWLRADQPVLARSTGAVVAGLRWLSGQIPSASSRRSAWLAGCWRGLSHALGQGGHPPGEQGRGQVEESDRRPRQPQRGCAGAQCHGHDGWDDDVTDAEGHRLWRQRPVPSGADRGRLAVRGRGQGQQSPRAPGRGRAAGQALRRAGPAPSPPAPARRRPCASSPSPAPMPSGRSPGGRAPRRPAETPTPP